MTKNPLRDKTATEIEEAVATAISNITDEKYTAKISKMTYSKRKSPPELNVTTLVLELREEMDPPPFNIRLSGDNSKST